MITPNLPEAAALLDTGIAADETAMRAQAARLLAMGAKAVLLKGGHGSGAESVDLLADAHGVTRFAAPRIETQQHPRHRLHAVVGHRRGPRQGAARSIEAVGEAKDYVTGAIAASDRLKVGSGHGPVHHFHRWWRTSPNKAEHGAST